MTAGARPPESRLLLFLQIVCAASAVGSLKPGMIDGLWLLAFILPAAFFLFLGTGWRRRLVPVWARFALAALAQAVAAYTASCYALDLDEKSSLACSLLPALTYFTLRREPSDTSLSLFLSFCFLLIGIMLNGDSANWTLLVFLGACSWALQIEATNRAMALRHATRGRMMPLSSRILRRSQVVAALMVIALVLYQGIGLIPSPGRTSNRTATGTPSSHGGRVLGLNSRFDLGGGEGNPLNLTSDRVIMVEDVQRKGVPSDLYLRMTYFDIAYDDEEWKTQPPDPQSSAVDPKRFDVRDPVPGLQASGIIVTRLEPAADGEIFLPPGTIRISDVRRLQFHRRSGFFRSLDPTEMRYGVIYQRPHKYRRSEAINRTLVSRRHRELPPGLRTGELQELAEQWAGRDPLQDPPMDVALRIAARLEARCRYALREPAGPYDDPLHNFLFGQNEGYCMHFATALAVMLRLVGIPCRIGVGFHAGEAAMDGARVFGSKHAHAWVELPLRRTGWTLIDPTPAADRAQRGWPLPNPTGDQDQGTGQAGVDLGGSCFLAGLRDPLASIGAFLTLATVLLGSTIGVILLAMRRSRSSATGRGVERPPPDAVRARRMLDQILHALAKGGHTKHHRATLEQYLQYLDREKELDHGALAEAFRAYQDIRFGAKHLDAERERCLAAGIATARALA